MGKCVSVMMVWFVNRGIVGTFVAALWQLSQQGAKLSKNCWWGAQPNLPTNRLHSIPIWRQIGLSLSFASNATLTSTIDFRQMRWPAVYWEMYIWLRPCQSVSFRTSTLRFRTSYNWTSFVHHRVHSLHREKEDFKACLYNYTYISWSLGHVETVHGELALSYRCNVVEPFIGPTAGIHFNELVSFNVKRS